MHPASAIHSHSILIFSLSICKRGTRWQRWKTGEGWCCPMEGGEFSSQWEPSRRQKWTQISRAAFPILVAGMPSSTGFSLLLLYKQNRSHSLEGGFHTRIRGCWWQQNEAGAVSDGFGISRRSLSVVKYERNSWQANKMLKEHMPQAAPRLTLIWLWGGFYELPLWAGLLFHVGWLCIQGRDAELSETHHPNTFHCQGRTIKASGPGRAWAGAIWFAFK